MSPAQILFVQMAMAAACACATAPAPYRATEQSGAKTRQALGAAGLRNIPGPRKKRPTAADKANALAASIGYVNGKRVG